MKSQEDLVSVTRFGSEPEAELARIKLQSEGIDAFVSKDDCGGMEPYLQFSSGVRLLVPKSRVRAARKLLGLPEEQ
jgi:hypothetical protein